MSDTETTALVAYFTALEKERFPYEAHPEPAMDDALIAEGRQVFTQAECSQCHRIGDYVPTGKKDVEQGPNFRLAHERLRFDWMERFIPDPQAFIPGAKMPSFFGSKPYSLQTPEKQRQITAVTAY